jgi:hypothetical protein
MDFYRFKSQLEGTIATEELTTNIIDEVRADLEATDFSELFGLKQVFEKYLPE